MTPIYWDPAGHPMSSSYKNIISTYLGDVAAASDQHTNVFSTLNEYFGSNGTIRYQVRLGTPINDTSRLPASGCIVTPKDTSGIYADNSGYNACIDDAQVIDETSDVVSARRLPVDLRHIYVMFVAKHVETCFYAGSTETGKNSCTINYHKSAAYCAYHSQAPNGMIYANLSYPIYKSATGFTCSSDAVFPFVAGTERQPRRGHRDQPDQSRDHGVDHRPGYQHRLVRLQWLREWRRMRLRIRSDQRHARAALQPGDQRPPLPDPGGVQQPRLLQHRSGLSAERVTTAEVTGYHP